MQSADSLLRDADGILQVVSRKVMRQKRKSVMGSGPVSEITRNQEGVTDLECDVEAVKL